MSGPLPVGPYREPLPAPRPEDQEAHLVLVRELDPGEQLLWAGRPHRGLRLTRRDVSLIPFSVVWCGFAIVWELLAIFSGAPLFFVIWGIPFVAFGLYSLLGRYFHDAYRRARLFYGLTDRRAIILDARGRRRTLSYDLDAPEPIELTEERRGRGTIRFGHVRPRGWGGDSGSSGASLDMVRASVQEPPTFESVSDARALYERVREAQRKLVEARTRRRLPR